MSKMTKKEFLEIFEAAGFSFEVWGYEGILNMIAGYSSYLSKDAARRGSAKIAAHIKEQGDIIEAALTARGYYENTID